MYPRGNGKYYLYAPILWFPESRPIIQISKGKLANKERTTVVLTLIFWATPFNVRILVDNHGHSVDGFYINLLLMEDYSNIFEKGRFYLTTS